MYRLPESLRPAFQKPMGPVVQTPDLAAQVRPGDVLVCIGDLVSKSALEVRLAPKVIIVDYKTERTHVGDVLAALLRSYGKTVMRAANPPATVTPALYGAVVQALRIPGTVRIEVDGEEDLAGLPVFAEAAAGTVVFYGMPGQGVVVVRVDEAVRATARDLLERMREA